MSAWVPDESGGYVRELRSGVALAVDRSVGGDGGSEINWYVLADGEVVDQYHAPNIADGKRAAEQAAITLLKADLADLETP